MNRTSIRGDDSKAESLFADFLASAAEIDEAGFRALCERSPAYAIRLRELWGERAEWEALGGVPGIGADSKVRSTPARASTGTARQSLDELLAQLEAHRAPCSRYDVGKEIARGGMGAIQELFDRDLRRDLVRKTQTRAADAEPGDDGPRTQRLHRFIEEAQITAQLSHPGVVPVHELCLDADGRVFFTMARVGGKDLEHVFERVRAGDERWNTTRVLDVLLKVCDTLAYAHGRGIVHRDLKPANVMVGEFGEVYVMDWGLAKVAGADDTCDLRPDLSVRKVVSTARRDVTSREPSSSLMTMDGTIMGTPSFMSPEQARGEALDMRSDVYALGAMLYALLAGRTPYTKSDTKVSPFEIVLAIQKGAPEPLEHLAPKTAPELLAICTKAMQREPGKRYADTRELAQDLRRYLEGRVVLAHKTGAYVELVKWVGRNKGTAGALAGLLAAIVAGATVAIWSAATVADKNTRILGLADQKKFDDLVAEEVTLWPALPKNGEALRSWVARADALQANVSTHRESLKLLSSRSSGVEDAWLEQKFGALIDELEHALPTLAPKVAARRDLALSLAERTLTGDDARKRWDEAISDVASLPKYAGLQLKPQPGLLPLGRNARSGLWEFHHVLSGDAPRQVEGQWVVTATSGLVLVLLPAATTTIGSRADDPMGMDRDLPRMDGLRLDPFFVSKYETTQGQWQRWTGANPSQHTTTEPESALHPVDGVSWNACRSEATKLDLELPTEARWEHACRAGTTTAYWTGDEFQSIERSANIADAPLAHQVEDAAPWNDGANYHVPVGSLAANAFGLYDVMGNVWEWCLDDFSNANLPRAGDGARGLASDSKEGVLRGGSFYSNVYSCRSANRSNQNTSNTDGDIGVRFVRRLDP